MFSLPDELRELLGSFERRGVSHALCGGLALAVYGHPRSTLDIDLLILADDLDEALAAAAEAGFDTPAAAMEFAGGAVPMRRVSKYIPDLGEHVPLDLILATEATRTAWDSRVQAHWPGGALWVVSREGLIALKRLRNSAQDRADIEILENPHGR
jgi:hypothetical protein